MFRFLSYTSAFAPNVDKGNISVFIWVDVPTSQLSAQLYNATWNVTVINKSLDTVLMKKVSAESFAELTKPLREAKKKIREEDVPALIHRVRKSKK